MKNASLTFSYDSDLLGGGLMVRESRLIAGLLLSGIQPGHPGWQRSVIEENILQKARPATAKRNAQAIFKRLERLEPDFWRALVDADQPLAVQICFITLLARNLLLLEFLETRAHASALLDEPLKPYTWEEFLDERAAVDPKIATWTQASRTKMRQVAFRALHEAGLLESTRTGRLQKVILLPELAELLEAHQHDRLLKAMRAVQDYP